jgi:hypothetical protein
MIIDAFEAAQHFSRTKTATPAHAVGWRGGFHV